ncbi:MAG: FAD binding domain-containing protein [Polyangiaceae bacterium]|nr:FAD binding domain-containing protein [Polyangiaceae bacterium]
MAITDLELHSFVRLPTIADVLQTLADRHAASQKTVVLAGGTDWVVEQEMAPPHKPGAELPMVVDISRLSDLQTIHLNGNLLTIGAAATYLQLRRHPHIGMGDKRAALLARMAQDLGALQIQARGTLGGNLATGSPAADGVAALMAYDASVVLQSVRGERTVPITEFQTGYKKSVRAPDEIITQFQISLPTHYNWYWRKVGTRRAQAISKVALAGVAVVESGQIQRIGLGMASVAPVTAALRNTRSYLCSAPLHKLTGAELDAAVNSDCSPIDDVRSTRQYRAHCARVVVREFARSLGAPV